MKRIINMKRINDSINLNEATNTNSKFREDFDNLMDQKLPAKDNMDKIRNIIDKYSKGLRETKVFTSNQINDLSKNQLYDLISDVCYHRKDGEWIKVNDRLCYYVYMGGLIDTGYLYNIGKYSMTIRNVFGSSNVGDAYRELIYKADHNSLKSISILS